MNRKIFKMKNLIYSMTIITLLLFSQALSAQINLEHTFEGQVTLPNSFYISNSTDYYIATTNNQIKFYNMDYSLYKTVNIVPPTGYAINQSYMFSTNLFNTDNKVEFLVLFLQLGAPASDSYSTLRLYNDEGTLIKDFGYNYLFSCSSHKTNNNQCRLSILVYHFPQSGSTITYTTDIYSLPGTVTSVAQPLMENSSLLPPYPNPANTTITLPYQLKQGEMSVMRIFNLTGQLIETKQIDFVFDKLLLNVSSYTKGIYFYEVNGVSNRFIVE